MKLLEKEPLASTRHEARVDRLALASMPTLWPRIVDFKGRPTALVRALSPERDIASFPRIKIFRWLQVNGRWADIETGASGDGVIALIEFLSAGASKARCVEFLEQTLAELDASAA